MFTRIEIPQLGSIDIPNTIDNEEIGIFVLNGDALCKKLHIDYKRERNTELISLNAKYNPIKIGADDSLRTIGQVLGKGKWDNWS